VERADSGTGGGARRREGAPGLGELGPGTPSGAPARRVRIVALGNPDRGDDGAALAVADRFRDEADVVLAGRPGAGLLDLLPSEERCILMDVVASGSPPGTLHRIPLDQLTRGVLPDSPMSSHGFGPGEALSLARALGRPLPGGLFLGIEGEAYGLGEGLSPAVRESLPRLEEAVRQGLAALRGI
jgi:hydrogenase maturation protease